MKFTYLSYVITGYLRKSLQPDEAVAVGLFNYDKLFKGEPLQLDEAVAVRLFNRDMLFRGKSLKLEEAVVVA
jgi:hypothetical protein